MLRMSGFQGLCPVFERYQLPKPEKLACDSKQPLVNADPHRHPTDMARR